MEAGDSLRECLDFDTSSNRYRVFVLLVPRPLVGSVTSRVNDFVFEFMGGFLKMPRPRNHNVSAIVPMPTEMGPMKLAANSSAVRIAR